MAHNLNGRQYIRPLAALKYAKKNKMSVVKTYNLLHEIRYICVPTGAK